MTNHVAELNVLRFAKQELENGSEVEIFFKDGRQPVKPKSILELGSAIALAIVAGGYHVAAIDQISHALIGPEPSEDGTDVEPMNEPNT